MVYLHAMIKFFDVHKPFNSNNCNFFYKFLTSYLNGNNTINLDKLTPKL